MTSFLTRTAATLCLAGIALTAPASAQQAEPAATDTNRVLKATHGAWEVHCLEGTETCVMQHLGKTSDGKRALLVTIERLAGVTADGQAVPAAMTVHTPLGVLIPYNVRVKVDEGDVKPVQLVRCATDNCMARAPMSEEDVASFKGGTTAKFGFFLTEEVLVDVSLTGFTAAYEELTPVQVDLPGQN